ncbi:GCN5-related N-acetyltransferase [Xanthobacter versatilis]|uniref:GCN5-related N-acetyltransferase n=1 Tax=Xanthobacter autotrophicus (strain ATCC BAA-1158 / Py2) TaxID=78245 RepID=A7ICS3_XANP2|nr:GCN5-related N-acetyltransferase [Xanthobacter autotrophicus Py2]
MPSSDFALKRARLSAPVEASTHVAHSEALEFLLPLSNDYPDIMNWYRRRVVPGLHNGTRHIIRAERDGRLVGLGIAKNELGERKICTVRVSPTHHGRGIGVRLFDGLLRWLDVDKPHLTVSKDKLPQFERIFEYYGFEMTSEKFGVYTPYMSELGYNESPSNILAQGVLYCQRSFNKV